MSKSFPLISIKNNSLRCASGDGDPTLHWQEKILPHAIDPENIETKKNNLPKEALWDQDFSLSTLKIFLHQMSFIRYFEECAFQSYLSGEISGFCHLCIGQEAVPVASAFAMTDDDTMITAYRAHGHALAKGMAAQEAIGELMGRRVGCSKGKGGSMHMFDKKNKFYGGHGIVGAQISLGTGLAFSHKYLNDGGVCLIFLGDGASNQGQFFESMNMASLWNLPALYIIENNGYAMGTSVKRACAGNALHSRGEPFGISGHLIKGNDVIKTYRAIKELLEQVRSSHRPALLEIDTYRFKGHSMSDPAKYRLRQEVEEARQFLDPIIGLRTYLMEEHCVTKEELQNIEKEARQNVDEAFALAKSSFEPDPKELWQDIFL
jgi:pyruvate dehydrogenase E1 component alpha subunit